MRRIRWCDLPNDQKIVQHPHRSELLLNGRFGPRKVLNPGSHMERSHCRDFQAMNGAPIKKLPASPRVSSPSVPVADRGGEEVNLDFGNFGAGRSNQLREQSLGRSAGHDREFSLGNNSHMGPLKDVMFYTHERERHYFV